MEILDYHGSLALLLVRIVTKNLSTGTVKKKTNFWNFLVSNHSKEGDFLDTECTLNAHKSSDDVQDVFWNFYMRSLYALCLDGDVLFEQTVLKYSAKLRGKRLWFLLHSFCYYYHQLSFLFPICLPNYSIK